MPDAIGANERQAARIRANATEDEQRPYLVERATADYRIFLSGCSGWAKAAATPGYARRNGRKGAYILQKSRGVRAFAIAIRFVRIAAPLIPFTHAMKKVVFALIAAVASISAVAPAYANAHHHPVCHKVHVHGHWQKVCR